MERRNELATMEQLAWLEQEQNFREQQASERITAERDALAAALERERYRRRREHERQRGQMAAAGVYAFLAACVLALLVYAILSAPWTVLLTAAVVVCFLWKAGWIK